MCDILNINCSGCKKLINMHLGDYNTKAKEIQVYHEGCCTLSIAIPIVMKKRWVLWKEVATEDSIEPLDSPVVVVSLTDNAWKNKKGNHPNWGDYDIVKESE